MPPPIKTSWKSADFDIEFTSDQPISVDNPFLVRLLSALKNLDDKTPLQSFDVSKAPGPDPLLYTYDFTAADGRSWHQQFRLPVGDEPSMNFEFEDFWKKSEFVPHRDVRDRVLDMMPMFGVQKITAEFKN